MDTEKFNTFIQLLKITFGIKKPPFDLGLIVKEPKAKISTDDVFSELKKQVPIERTTYEKGSIDEEIVEKIIKIFNQKRWVFLEIKKDISSLLLNQLKYLSNHNSLQLIDYQGQDLVEIKMPKESRVIVFADRDFIENRISYPHFYRLFGPTLSLK